MLAYSRSWPSGERMPLVWMPWPLSIRIFMGCRGQLGDSGDKDSQMCRERNNRE